MRTTQTNSFADSSNGSRPKPPYRASTSKPATSIRPSHSDRFSHQSEIASPLSSVMSIRLSCLDWSTRWRMPFCSCHSPSMRAAIFGSKTKKFQAKRPPGRRRGVDPLEDAAPVGPGRQVAAARGRGSRRARPARPARGRACRPAGARARRPPRRRARAPAPAWRARVDPEHGPPGLSGDRDRHSPVADRELDERAFGLARELDVERDVLGHVRRPVVVSSAKGS